MLYAEEEEWWEEEEEWIEDPWEDEWYVPEDEAEESLDDEFDEW